MTKIQLYIATTIDGYIAREDGSLDWLNELPNPSHGDYGYGAFIKDIDMIVIGRKTYEEVLGFDTEWPYTGSKCYVATSKSDYDVKTENTAVLTSISAKSIDDLKSNAKKNVWVIGGGEVITHFLNEEAIDEMIICIVPIILGKGIPLFPNAPKETKFDLEKTEPFENGAVLLTYRKK